MATYSSKAALRTAQRESDTQYLKKLGAQQAAQNFIDAYMAPNTMSDLFNRLGELVTSNDASSTVSDYTFPPFNLDVTQVGLGTRAGGFKQLNDKINRIQTAYRTLTGEIRTKITEWDLSLYLQEQWLTTDNMFDLSLLYRIFVDNPSGYLSNPSGDPDTRALAYGLINAALNYEYRYALYNPQADPDLIYWAPPTEDLSASQRVPSSHTETTKSGGINLFGWKIFQKKVENLIWDVLPPPAMNDWQKEQVRIATDGGWSSWNPQMWQLFFNSDNPATINEDDYVALIDKINQSAKKRQKVAATPGVKPSTKDSSLVVSGTVVNQTGLNLKSPLWYGYPYGRYSDPRSLQGYLSNTDLNIVKVDTTSDITKNINRSYPFGNPMDGLDKLINGWTSTYDVVTYTESSQQVYHPGTGRRSGRLEEDDTQGYYTTETVLAPTVSSATTSNNFTNGAGLLKVPSTDQRIVQQKVFGYFGETSKATKGGDGGGDPIQSWGWKSQAQTIDTSTILQIDNFEGMDISTVLPDPGVSKPVLIVGEPSTAGGAPAFAFIAPMQKVMVKVTSSYRVKFMWWYYNVTKTVDTWVYQIDMAKCQGFSINTGSNNLAVCNPQLPLQYFKNGVRFKGVFFSIPKRTLSAGSNLITDGWPGGSSISTAQGTAIATALLNPIWYNGSKFIRAPLHRALDSLSTIITPIGDTLAELHTLFSPSSSPVVRALVTQLPEDIQAKQTIQNAYSLFSGSKRGAILTRVESAQAASASLIAAINNMRTTRGTYTYGDASTFFTQYSVVASGATNETTLAAIRSYLDLLYEHRLLILSKRLNKADGTLINVGRVEFALAQMQDSVAENYKPTSLLIQEKLKVVHNVTNISLMDRATKVAADLPTEKIRIVYVKVDYDETGEIIRPAAGNYQLYSQEIIENQSLTPAIWYISFKEGLAPNIIKNVITTLDGQKLTQIMADTNLTSLEKICYARELEDWWEIVVPESVRPEAVNYKTNLMLVLDQPEDFIEQYLNITSSVAASPVIDNPNKIEMGSTWLSADGVTDTLTRLSTT